MPKPRTSFICQECGHKQAKWTGKCPKCGAWDAMKEVSEAPAPQGKGGVRPVGPRPAPQPLPDIRSDDIARIPLAIGEMSRVLGGGIMPGGGVLISGDPGIGKSTLLMQMAATVARSGRTVLYVSGEESAYQVKRRAQRLGGVPGHRRFHPGHFSR